MNPRRPGGSFGRAGVVYPDELNPEGFDPPGGIGRPVEFIYNRAPWDDSTWLPGTPHNLPAPGDRLRPRGINSIEGGLLPGAPNSVPAPGSEIVRVRDRHRYAQVIELTRNVDAASLQILTEPTGLRNFLLIRNASAGAQIMFVSFGNQATLQSSLRLGANQAALFDTVVPQNEIFAICDIAGGLISVGYSNYAPS